MVKVDKLSDFPSDCYVAQFLGKDYYDAVESARKMLTNPTHYFEQIKIGRSNTILVAYPKPNEENIDAIHPALGE